MDAEELKKLHELKEQGVRTEEEFNAKKQEMLNAPSAAPESAASTPAPADASTEKKQPVAIASVVCGTIAGLLFLSLEGSMIPSRGDAQLAIVIGLAGMICGYLTRKNAAGPKSWAMVGLIGGALGFFDGIYIETQWQEMEDGLEEWGEAMEELGNALEGW